MKKLSLKTRQIVAAIAAVQLLFFILNYYRLQLFDPYDKKALVLSGVFAGICVLFFAPTVEEQREYRRNHPD